MNLAFSVKESALSQAKEEDPKEACGCVVIFKGRQRYFPCKNIAETPDEHFVLSPDDYLEAEKKGEIIAIIHSHPCTNHNPSPADRVACQQSGLPWFVVNPKTEQWGYCEPDGFELEYVGREFSHGIVDCYTLWQDWYKRELGILMSHYDRRDQWWNKGENLYLDNFAKEGMREVSLEEMKYGDILLMQLDSPVPNHAAIYLGNNLVLHHVQGRLSSRDVYKWGGYYHKATSKCLRHESR
mgnify:CR=1 FL=1